jgi:hypothetical protein
MRPEEALLGTPGGPAGYPRVEDEDEFEDEDDLREASCMKSVAKPL